MDCLILLDYIKLACYTIDLLYIMCVWDHAVIQ